MDTVDVQKRTSRTPGTRPPANPAWDDIRHFLALARLGSLSAVARELGVEHSTVARRVDALEKSLGLRLFDRLPRRWVLTAEGRALAARGAAMDHAAEDFNRALLGVSDVYATVRLSAPPVLASHFIAPRLAARRRDWADVELELVGESRDSDLARGDADLAIRLHRPTQADLAVRSLGKLGYGLYAHPAVAARPATDWPFLGYNDPLAAVPQQRWLDGLRGHRRYALRCNDLATLLHAARAGLGVAALPHFLAAGEDDLVRLGDAQLQDPRGVWLVMHADLRRAPRVRRIAAGIVAIFNEAALQLAGR